MVNLNDVVLVLRAKRQELLDQLDAVDKALAALSGIGDAVTLPPGRNPQEPPETPDGTVTPTRLKARRILSDAHKHALSEGRRKARHAKDAAAGLARELPEPAVGLAPASSAEGRQPRLVKRTKP